MRVIEPGVEGGLWKQEVRCTGAGNGNDGCGALLEVQAADLFHTANTDYGGDTTDYITIECPLCEKWNDLKQTGIPYGIRHSVLAQPNQVPRKKR